MSFALRNSLMGTVFRGPCFAPDDGGAGGGASPAVVLPPVVEAPLAGGAPLAGDAKPAAAAQTSILSDAKPPEPVVKTPEQLAADLLANETPEAKVMRETRERVDLRAKETPEQKAAREAAETPAQKAAREADDASVKAADTAAHAALIKPYEGLKLPEGMPRDQPAFVEFVDAAAKLGVTPEHAQSLVDVIAPKLQAAIVAPYELWATMQEAWGKAAANDKEYGGTDYEKNLGFAAQALDAYGNGKAVREALAFSGAGSNPEVIRYFVRAGKAQAEGSPINGRPAQASDKTLAERVYPEMNPAA